MRFDVASLLLAAAPAGWQSTALLIVGIASVLGLIIALRLNAFLALILSALLVSIGVGYFADENLGGRLRAVVDAFGASAGGIGIAIAMAAIIGKCMLDSGAADRIVRFAVGLTGDRNASLGLTLAGFVLAIPVFFDTVFYLLVPLGRSLYRRTNKNYLRYLMAIATGGAITHTLVPPTPGPLLVAATLGVDVGMMMMVGALVALPAAAAGLVFSVLIDVKYPIEMRPVAGSAQRHDPLPEDRLPSLGVSLLPVLVPVVLIGAGTLIGTLADREDLARLAVTDVTDFERIANELSSAEDATTPSGRFLSGDSVDDETRRLLSTPPADGDAEARFVEALNNILITERDVYDRDAFAGIDVPDVAEALAGADATRMKPVDRRRMNRLLLEAAFPTAVKPHRWDSPTRRMANRFSLYSDANFALTLAALIAMLTLKNVRGLTWKSLGDDTEEALMSGGIIILITAAGGAFGAMLKDTNVDATIRGFFDGSTATGVGLLLLGWSISAVLKVAQGSSTVAMIVGAGMMAAIIGDTRPDYHLVYVAAAVGSGSLMGSWMNDSGFWVFTKMGGLTEAESLRSWTPLLAVLSVGGLVATIFWSRLLPLAEAAAASAG